MESTNNLESLENSVGELKSKRCEQRFKIFSDYKEAFGDRFDVLEFLNYKTGGVVKGAELRDVQTGCEIYERLGWDSAVHNEEEFHKCGCKQFDEQLMFISEKGDSLSNTAYRLTLGDGRTVSGRTDNDGKTNRIRSCNKPLAIERAEFFVPENIPRCPGKEVTCGPDEAVKRIEIDGIVTTMEYLGSSMKTVVLKINDRPLTAGEIAMARLVFKDSINYSTVRIHNEEYLPFDLQDDRTAMTPNGSMYFNPKKFISDFSLEDEQGKIWFMHEMVHVWQYQLGYSVTWSGFWIAVTGGYVNRRAYRFDRSDYKDPKDSSKDSPDIDKTLPDFNMEQQGDIIAEYFGAKHLGVSELQINMAFYGRVLKEFIRSPKNASLLPN
jgi:type VI secretion system secreted protein VgrG